MSEDNRSRLNGYWQIRTVAREIQEGGKQAPRVNRVDYESLPIETLDVQQRSKLSNDLRKVVLFELDEIASPQRLRDALQTRDQELR